MRALGLVFIITYAVAGWLKKEFQKIYLLKTKFNRITVNKICFKKSNSPLDRKTEYNDWLGMFSYDRFWLLWLDNSGLGPHKVVHCQGNILTFDNPELDDASTMIMVILLICSQTPLQILLELVFETSKISISRKLVGLGCIRALPTQLWKQDSAQYNSG